jgi:3-phosphoglycerate kinase
LVVLKRKLGFSAMGSGVGPPGRSSLKSKKPFVTIVGRSKVSSKIGGIESLLEKVNILLLGGGMIFTFYKAQGFKVGASLVEEDKLELQLPS